MSRPNIMLGSLNIGCYTARKTDKKSARKIESEAHAKEGTSSASKNLLADVPQFVVVQKNAAKHRTWWTTITLPWGEGKGGLRALNSIKVMDTKREVGDRVREYMELVDDFISVYPVLRANRQFDMGDLFDPKEFPEPQAMRRKFYVYTSWCALPDSEDIRIAPGLDKDEADALVAEAVKAEQCRVQKAVDTAAARLFKVVEAMHKTMATPIGEAGAKFNDTKLENILSVVDLIPAFNITNDPKLNEMAKAAKKLAQKSPDELREDVVKRAEAAKEAKNLAAKLAGAFNVDEEEDE